MASTQTPSRKKAKDAKLNELTDPPAASGFGNDGELLRIKKTLTGRLRKATAGTEALPIVFQQGGITPYKLATFGDSRANTGSHRTTVTGVGINGEKVASQLCMLRGDMEIVFNGGISGDTAVNWNSAARVASGQTVKDLIASQPDACKIQYGINDYIAGTAASVVVAALKELIAKVIGAGIPVVFESTNPAAATSVSYINGYAASGGFGASAAAKLAEMQSGNAQMQAWLAQFPGNIAKYVDTSSVTTGDDGYAKTDQTYFDGTHMARNKGARPCAALIDAAISEYFPRRYGQLLKAAYPNGLNRCWLSPTSGRASGVSTPQNESGTVTATYQIVVDDDGDLCQEINLTATVLNAGAFRTRIDLSPDWVGATPFFTIAAGDVLQACVDYE
ncbi:MAG: GDSL-type esterase/lipase family protein, partial [Ferribacterium limneticum]